jgi:NADPH2:quinone reductase
MRAVQVVRLDGPAAVEVRDVPVPARAPQQVLVDVAAVGVNFPDVLQTKGLYQYRPELPYTLGSEVAGVVREAPDGSPLRAGDRVVAFTTTGAFAEVVAATRLCAAAAGQRRLAAGAGLPMNYPTAHFALVAGAPAGGPGRPGQGRRAVSARRACSWPPRWEPRSSRWCPATPRPRSPARRAAHTVPSTASRRGDPRRRRSRRRSRRR